MTNLNESMKYFWPNQIDPPSLHQALDLAKKNFSSTHFAHGTCKQIALVVRTVEIFLEGPSVAYVIFSPHNKLSFESYLILQT